MEQNVLLDLSHISKRYKTELALKDINITLHKGEILGFLGPSGAGKTTTIKIITGQLRQKFLIQIRLILMNQFMKKLVWFLIRAEFMRK